jgi:uroporphyrinogen-III decarboxylase
MSKTEETLDRWCSATGLAFASDEAEAAYKARARRIADAILLKTPDRVPVAPSFGMFPALDNGYTCEEVMFDYDKAEAAWLQTLQDFEPDAFTGSGYAQAGPVFETLDYKLLKLPGREVAPESVFQFNEWEHVTAEAFYDPFLDDPTDFMMRTYFPTVYGALAPLKELRPLRQVFGYYLGTVPGVLPFGRPEVVEMLDALKQAGEEAMRFAEHLGREQQRIVSLGYPNPYGAGAAAPFDLIGDWFRGTRGVMTDMYRHPDKLLQALERLVPIAVRMGVDGGRASGKPVVGLMLHKGAEGFMSLEQFKTFYWPTLRKVMLGIIEEGFVPMPLYEGRYTDRLEIISDIPRAKALYWFESVDIHRAAEVLGDRVCFRGNVPISLLYAGSVQQVEDYVRELIDVFGRDGGLIVDCGMWFDEAKHENVKAMVDVTKEYGVN